MRLKAGSSNQDTNASALNEGTHTGELKIGVIGCGYWGPKLARNFHDLPGSALKMVSDLREDRLIEIQKLYPEVAVTFNYHDLIESDLDALVIATPVRTHYPIAKEALLAGKHVLVEKPITARSDHAEELIALADERGLKLVVGHTFVYNPAVQAVREIVQSGELGKVCYLNSTRVNLGLFQSDINVMWDLGPHDVSMIRFILGADPVSVSARGAIYVNTTGGLHEVVYMLLMFEGGIMANLRMSWLDPIKQRSLTIVGSKKMLVYDDIADEKVAIYDKGVEVPPYSVTEDDFRASYWQGEGNVYHVDWVEPLKVQCSHFLDAIRTGAASPSSGEAGLKVVKVLETAQRSLMNYGVELRIEY